MAFKNSKSTYCCINTNDALCPNILSERSMCFKEDIADMLVNAQKY